MTWWLTVSNTYIWHCFATELLKMGRPHHRNNTVAFFLTDSAWGHLCRPSSSRFPLCHLFLAETGIKLNTEEVQCLKGLGEMLETTEIEYKYMWEPPTLADAEWASCFSALAREWTYPPLIRRCQCWPWPSPCSEAEQRKAHGSFMKFTFCSTKMPFNTCAYGCNVSGNISGYQLVSGRCIILMFPNGRTRWGVSALGGEKAGFTALNMLFIPLTFELPKHKNILSLVQLSLICQILTGYTCNF